MRAGSTRPCSVTGALVVATLLVAGCSGNGATGEPSAQAPAAPVGQVGTDVPAEAITDASGAVVDAETIRLATASVDDERVARQRPDLFGPTGLFNRKPPYVREVRRADYDGDSDDLLTAGLGASGLAGLLPAFADPLHPTAAELRRAAIYNSHRALLDMTAAGGYGVFYGPNVAPDGTVAGEGRIGGTEVLAFSDDGDGTRNGVLMVQIPSTFDPRKACIVTATSSGSRGIYGAISTGEWGLKQGCAVAYTDKGTGAGPHDLSADTVALIDGTRTSATEAGTTAQFRAPLDDSERATFAATHPGRFAFKHAHSRQNPERDWGRFTLQAIEFAYWILNERYGHDLGHGLVLRRVHPVNTMVIASSLSNGGGAAIAAAELDRLGLINGVAVSEPAVELPRIDLTVRRGPVEQVVNGRTLYDFVTYAQLYQPCAALSARVAGAPGLAFVAPAIAGSRCASLKDKGLLTGDTIEAQADDALDRLGRYGWEPESAILQASMAAFEVSPAVAVTFGNAHARAGVNDSLCGYGFAAAEATGAVTSLDPVLLASMAATGNGVPPSTGVQLINERDARGPVRDLLSQSPSTGRFDGNLDGALCLRDLLSGGDEAALALQTGLDDVRRNGDLRGKPAIIVHGRDDALLPVSQTSRPYVALNRDVEGSRTRLRYIEVTNAQHFDAFIGLPLVLPGYDSRYVPLHVYLNRALDAMAAHLREHKPLPPSQVVRTVARGGTPGAAPPLTEANLPGFSAEPAEGDQITVEPRVITVPD